MDMMASSVASGGSSSSIILKCVRISNCSRLFLSMCGDLLTVYFEILVGRGIGPFGMAPVRLAVATMSCAHRSRMRASKDFSRNLTR